MLEVFFESESKTVELLRILVEGSIPFGQFMERNARLCAKADMTIKARRAAASSALFL
jgi:hypothetical protein